MKKILNFLSLLLCFTSCVQIVEDITINNDGSGNAKYTFNASESKSKIDAIMLLDSVNGFKVPKISELKIQMSKLKSELINIKGITNINYTFNEDLLKVIININFTNIKVLTEIQNKLLKDKARKINYSFSNKLFKKELETINNQNISDVEELGDASFISIIRFKNDIISVSNSNSSIASNKKGVMTKTLLSELISNPKLLNNQILIK